MSGPSLATVELCLRLPRLQAASAPAVRLLVDPGSCTSLHSEMEVALQLDPKLQADPKWTFRGSFVMEHAGASAWLYRLGLCAPPGTLWSLRIRDGQNRYLLSDADTLDAPKSWLVGSCPHAVVEEHAEVARLEDYRTRRAGGARGGRARE